MDSVHTSVWRLAWIAIGLTFAPATTVAAPDSSQCGDSARTEILNSRNSPFPYYGRLPDDSQDFFDVSKNGRKGHTSPRGGVLWEDTTYSDKSTLVYFPKGFSLEKPAVIVVYFHGNSATLRRDVIKRQRIPEQVAKSGLNAVLVAPQFAVDALDSSAGGFWAKGKFAQFMVEMAGFMAVVCGRRIADFMELPIIVVAYSGGYNAAAYVTAVGEVGRRIRGVILLDAVYGEQRLFADFVEKFGKTAFFVSAYSSSTKQETESLKRLLSERAISHREGLPAELKLGDVVFLRTKNAVEHRDFATDAWVHDPVADVLSRIRNLRS